LEGSVVDADTGLISKDGKGVGIKVGDKIFRGFKTPSRKMEIRSLFVNRIAKNEDCTALISASGSKASNRPSQHAGHNSEVSELPIWIQPEELTTTRDDELVMTSFKWNVHNHGRTMNLKWLAEIVHTNPAWMNPKTAASFGLKDGDWIELLSFHSKQLETQSAHLNHTEEIDEATGRRIVSRMRVPIVTMEGLHPKAIAMSNSCGHSQYTNVAQAKKSRATDDKTAGMDTDGYRDPDWERNMWWEDQTNNDPATWKPNTGNGWNQNKLLPIAPDPVTGQQAFHGTIVRVTKL
jgi:thiosulfate reductase / polysulfide reductase chain A